MTVSDLVQTLQNHAPGALVCLRSDGSESASNLGKVSVETDHDGEMIVVLEA